MPLATRYKKSLVFHLLPIGGEKQEPGKIVPHGFIGSPLCGADPIDVAEEVNASKMPEHEFINLNICKKCVSKSLRINSE